MDKKNNMKQAMFELFGAGGDAAIPNAAEVSAAFREAPSPAVTPESAAEIKASPTDSYLGRGSVICGTLYSGGNVEVAGNFQGDIVSDGMVILHADVQANVSAGSLTLADCTLTGDAEVKTAAFIARDSAVLGNIKAKELQCHGAVNGDLRISDNAALGETARVNGSIETASLSVAKGAVLSGRIDVGGKVSLS